MSACGQNISSLVSLWALQPRETLDVARHCEVVLDTDCQRPHLLMAVGQAPVSQQCRRTAHTLLHCRVSCNRLALCIRPAHAAAKAGHHSSCNGEHLVSGASHLGDGGGQAGLRLAQDARLRVVVALPGELPRRAVPQPHKHRRQRLRRVLAAPLHARAMRSVPPRSHPSLPVPIYVWMMRERWRSVLAAPLTLACLSPPVVHARCLLGKVNSHGMKGNAKTHPSCPG